MTDFGTTTLPYGVIQPPGLDPRVAVAVGECALDLAALVDSPEEFAQSTLNPFMAKGPARWSEVRELVKVRVAAGVSPHHDDVYRLAEVEVRSPVEVADFVDFFSGIEHATNMGHILRPTDENPLKPNYRHLPVGYHGRAGTVLPSGVHIVRPSGQVLSEDGVVFTPSRRLDVEVELGYVVGMPSPLGTPVPAGALRDHVFGVVLLIDWSARDIQAWEYQPLGPFLAKSFATSISSWVIPLDALDWVDGPRQVPEVLPHLQTAEPRNPAISIEVELNGTVISRPDSGKLYWSPAQQLAHMTSNGASLRTGDLYGTGTISSTAREHMGSLMELSWGGTEDIVLADGRTRRFLEDGDEIVLRGFIGGDTSRPLGEVSSRILPAAG
ncbi:fumarylacetoacetate hydrolase family protein [Mycolicibacterium litorale]|uniref:fumarylacetoacetate hydrolase family protein n=1 Tax=Mycolicibacterium litorale TaxID=758802 RepID=UPI003CF48FE4